jgi:hypothetical protein
VCIKCTDFSSDTLSQLVGSFPSQQLLHSLTAHQVHSLKIAQRQKRAEAAEVFSFFSFEV